MRAFPLRLVLACAIAVVSAACATSVPVAPDEDAAPKQAVVGQQGRTGSALTTTGGLQRSGRYILISSTGLIAGEKSSSRNYVLRAAGFVSGATRPPPPAGTDE